MKVKKYLVKLAALAIVGCMPLLSLRAPAQEVRSEVSVQGTGFFTEDSNGNGIENKATETAGLLIGYRYNISRWLAAEANYGYDRNTQSYIGSTSGRVLSNIHQMTGSAVVKLPGFSRIQPYALAGGGGLIFDPTDIAGGSFAGATSEARGAFLYGSVLAELSTESKDVKRDGTAAHPRVSRGARQTIRRPGLFC